MIQMYFSSQRSRQRPPDGPLAARPARLPSTAGRMKPEWLMALRRLLFGAVVAWLALMSQAVFARSILDLDVKAQPILLADWGDYWLDATGRKTPDQVDTDGAAAWQPTETKRVYPQNGTDALWIRFNVPPAPDGDRWYLELPYAAVNRVSLFTLDSADQWNEQKAGDQVAVSAWPVPHRHPLLPIALSAEVPTRYLLKIQNGSQLSAPLQFVSESYLNHSEQRVSLILGVFFGLAGLAALVSAISAVSLRDSAYGFYAASVTLMGLSQATATGIAGLHLWPNAPLWNDLAPSVVPSLEVAATLLFLAAAVALPERSLLFTRCVQVLAALGVFTTAGLAAVLPEHRSYLLIPYVVVSQIMAVSVLAWAWQRGDRFAPWLMLGFTPMLAMASYLLARNLGWISINEVTMHGAQIAAAFELPVVMVVLMWRSQHHRENTRRIQGLDRIDPATGLINGHVFVERLMRMMARSARFRHHSAVLLIDLVNTEQTQRDFGRKAADELPLRVAERLLSTAREIDSAARLSERRFGMLVDGPFSAEDAATLGPRIVARCLMPYKGLHVDCVAQVRLAYALVPFKGDDAQHLLAQLEQTLAHAGPDSKRAVFHLSDVEPAPRRRRSAEATAPTPL